MIPTNNETKEENEEKKEESPFQFLSQPEVRTIGLIGDVDEEKSADVMMGLLLLTKLSGKEPPFDPISMYISTYGGSADEMFGLYDMMTRFAFPKISR